MGRDSVVGHVTAPTTIQSSEARGDFLLQHEQDPFGVVQHLGNLGRTL